MASESKRDTEKSTSESSLPAEPAQISEVLLNKLVLSLAQG